MRLMPAPQKTVHDVFVAEKSHALHRDKAEKHDTDISE